MVEVLEQLLHLELDFVEDLEMGGHWDSRWLARESKETAEVVDFVQAAGRQPQLGVTFVIESIRRYASETSSTLLVLLRHLPQFS